MADILGAELHLALDDGEPRSFFQAEGHAAWRTAMKEEMDAVEKNEIWVFKAGAVIKHNARLVARGFVHQDKVNFNDAFAPVTQMDSVHLHLALAAQEGWCVHHMDVH
jgi:folate-dependent tRNA-U54 methylase TrmFO/GidA